MGQSIPPEYRTGEIDQSQIRIQGHKFNQARPGPSAWSQWRKLIQILCFKNGRLRTPLGAWIVQPKYQRRRWQAYWNPPLRRLYIRTEDVETRCSVPCVIEYGIE